MISFKRICRRVEKFLSGKYSSIGKSRGMSRFSKLVESKFLIDYGLYADK